MTDRELLELAARAAGLIPEDYIQSGNYITVFNPSTGTGRNKFSPLTDPGDALRLAVALELVVDLRCKGDIWPVQVGADNNEWVSERSNNTPLAATMRAITRAAAEIERAKT